MISLCAWMAAGQCENRRLARTNDSFSQQALDDLVLAELETAQSLLKMEGRLTRIDLILPKDYDTAQLQTLLPAGTILTTPRQRNDALKSNDGCF